MTTMTSATRLLAGGLLVLGATACGTHTAASPAGSASVVVSTNTSPGESNVSAGTVASTPAYDNSDTSFEESLASKFEITKAHVTLNGAYNTMVHLSVTDTMDSRDVQKDLAFTTNYGNGGCHVVTKAVGASIHSGDVLDCTFQMDSTSVVGLKHGQVVELMGTAQYVGFNEKVTQPTHFEYKITV